MEDIFTELERNRNCSKVGTASSVIFCVTGVSCSMSVIGAMFILYSYARLSNTRDDTRLLVVCLTVADLITAAGILIIPITFLKYGSSDKKEHISEICEICKAQSFITTFSGMASFFWTFAIALHITASCRTPRNTCHRRIMFILANILCWGVPGLICGLALRSDVLGFNLESTGPWCWIRGDRDITEDKMVTWMLVAGKGWEFLCYFASANLYILSKIHVYIQRRRFRRLQSLASYNSIQENDDNQSNRFTRHRNSLLYLLMALYLLRVWGTSRFVINILANRLEFSCTVHYILLILQSYGDSGQGFWNFVIFCCLDETVKFRKLCRLRRYGGGDYTDHERQHLVQEMVESSA